MVLDQLISTGALTTGVVMLAIIAVLVILIFRASLWQIFAVLIKGYLLLWVIVPGLTITVCLVVGIMYGGDRFPTYKRLSDPAGSVDHARHFRRLPTLAEYAALQRAVASKRISWCQSYCPKVAGCDEDLCEKNMGYSQLHMPPWNPDAP